VFVGSYEEGFDGTLWAIDAATGEQVLAVTVPSDWIFSSPTVHEGSVYVGSNDDTLYALDAGIEGSSEGSRVTLGTLGHTDAWNGGDPEPDPGTVLGTVTDTADESVADAEVALLDDGETIAESETDADGAYSLDAAPGTYDLVVEAAGFEPFADDVTVEAGTETERDVTLTPTEGTVFGVVTDTANESVADAEVALLDDGETVAGTETDTDGAYSLDVAPGTYDLAVEAAGFGPFAEEVTVEAGAETERDATLGPPALPGGEGPPQDLDGDGLYEDLDGDDEFDIADVQTLFENLGSGVLEEHPAAFDFAGHDPEKVTIFDVQALFSRLD